MSTETDIIENFARHTLRPHACEGNTVIPRIIHHTENGNHRKRLRWRRPVMFPRLRFRSLALTALRLSSHHRAIFSWFPVDMMTPSSWHSADAPFRQWRLLSHAPHTMLRIVFVAVDRARA